MPVISVCSPKGGVGKTTLASNLAAVFSQSGARVIAVDFDPQNSLRLYFGVPLNEERGFITRIAENGPDASWIDAVINVGKNLFVLPFGRSDEALRKVMNQAILTPGFFEKVQAPIFANPDILVICDFPPGYSDALKAIAPVTDISIVPLLADAASVSLLQTLEKNELIDGPLNNRLGYYIVLNHTDNRVRINREVQEFARQNFADRILGVIHADTSVPEAAAMQKSVAEFNVNSSAAFDIEVIARKTASMLGFDVKQGTMVLNSVESREGAARK
ncbi:MAG: ParA family protein [Succinivibrio sp.]